MSAYNASAPVTARNTAPRITSARPGCAPTMRSAYQGLMASSTRGALHDLDGAEDRERREPQQHDGTEQAADARRAAALDGEQRDDDAQRHRQHRAFELRIEHGQAFDRAQHRDRRRDQRVAVEQRRAEHAQRDRAPRPGVDRAVAFLDERHQRKNSAFAVVVGAHDHREVFHRHDDRQTPEDQRQQSEDRGLIAGPITRGGQRLLEGIQRTRADVAEHHADGADKCRR